MLKLTIPGIENWDSKNNVFVYTDVVELELEHSLVSLSKWEAEWGKPFLGPDIKSDEETLSYVRIMTLTPDISPEVYNRLSHDNIRKVNEYLEAKMTATWFNERGPQKAGPKKREIITAEIIYHWMISFQIPFEAEHWHLNRLITLIKVLNEKNAPADKNRKMSPREVAQRNRELNEQRLAKLGTSG